MSEIQPFGNPGASPFDAVRRVDEHGALQVPESPSPRERWAPVSGVAGYEVSDAGRIRSIDRVIVDRHGVQRRFKGKLLKPWPKRSGHLNVTFPARVAGGPQVVRKLHQVVLEAFVGPRPAGMMCRHLNGNPTDNRLTNLKWGTPLENGSDFQRHGTHPLKAKTHCPRHHPLVEPNLSNGHKKRGFRKCLACERTRAYLKNHVDEGLDFQTVADQYFKRIAFGGAAPLAIDGGAA